MDSNHRPPAYQADALTCWAISPYRCQMTDGRLQTLLPSGCYLSDILLLSRSPLQFLGREAKSFVSVRLILDLAAATFCAVPLCKALRSGIKAFCLHRALFSSWARRLAAGGDNRDRTDDPLLAKQVLSQLSYTPMLFGFLRISLWTPKIKQRLLNLGLTDFLPFWPE